MVPAIEIIVGTYSEYLLGYQLCENRDKNGEKQLQLKPTFADRSHDGSIKSLAVHKHWIATGGIDDRIFIYDMSLRKQAHVLNVHKGIVNTLVFSSDSTHLMSGGIDGRMIATRLANWSTEGEWPRPHNGKAVTHIACHPSSRMCLSLGADQVLNTWNLVKGRIAYRTNLKSKRTLGNAPDCLTWSPEGNFFTIAGPRTMEIWSIQTASVMQQISLTSKPICVAWLDEQNCVVGLENGIIAWLCLDEEKDTASKMIKMHENRVKGIGFMHNTLVTISSTGEIKAWKCNVDKMHVSLLACTNIDCRPTCLSLLDNSQFGKSQKSTPTLSIDKQQAARLAARIEALESLKPRSYVAIEYDENDENEENDDESEFVTSDTETEPSNSDSDVTYENDDDSEQEEEEEPKRKSSKKSPTKRTQAAAKQTHSKRAKNEK
ncbi:PREDICTED: p21-activated protein kinase-interacting protein 1-like [Drosophila arizonae]|uniref:P21-activated protein kinase-interacting protein 1-like n=1 Tax=Drosophila arizonae TaxID=7263 RepID=A0ABM1PRA2_DROAR|nr:PREDICTED: p21-activated protein kinase-interacting protein 1-like [Drosophila arizonae]